MTTVIAALLTGAVGLVTGTAIERVRNRNQLAAENRAFYRKNLETAVERLGAYTAAQTGDIPERMRNFLALGRIGDQVDRFDPTDLELQVAAHEWYQRYNDTVIEWLGTMMDGIANGAPVALIMPPEFAKATREMRTLLNRRIGASHR